MKAICTLALCAGLSFSTFAAGSHVSSEYASIEADSASSPAAQVFEARAGESMRVVLLRWSAQAGWAAPVWKTSAAVDFAVGRTMRLEASYPTAVRTFTAAVRGARLTVAVDEPTRQTVVQVAP